MILINKQINLQGGTLPYTYIIVPSQSCVTVVSSNLTNNVLSIVFGVNSIDCFSNILTADITVSTSDGCSESINITLPNPCLGFSITPITESNLTFTVSATGGNSANFDFAWEWPVEIFNKISLFDSTNTSNLSLSIKDTVTSFPSESIIRVTVTDSIGCSQELEYVYNFCIPQVSNLSLEANCINNTSIYNTGFYNIVSTQTCNDTLDYDTIELSLPNNVTYTLVDDTISFNIIGSSPSSYTIPYSIKTNLGVTSNVANFFITLNPCSLGQITGNDRVVGLLQSSTPGDIIEFPLSTNLNSINEIDYNSFIVESNITPTSPLIEVDSKLNGERIVAYTVPNPAVAESFQFTIADTLGNKSKAITYTYTPKVTTFTVNNDTVCLRAGTSNTLNYAANDVGDIDLSSLSIITPPNFGTYTKAGSTITYNAPSDFTGNQTIVYNLSDIYGETKQGTVTYTILNPGQVVISIATCSDGLYNLFSLLGNNITTGGTWTSTGAPAPTPVTYDADIDLTGVTGNLEFEYLVSSGACNLKSIIQINKTAGVAKSNDECATPTYFVSPAVPSFASSLIHTSNENCPSAAATLSVQAYPTTWNESTSDLWYAIALGGITANPNDITITVNSNSNGQTNKAEYVELAFYDTCGGARISTIDNFFRYQSNSAAVFTVGNIPTTLYVRVGDKVKGSSNLTLTITE